MYQGSAHRPPVRDHTAVLLAIERLDRGVASENPFPSPLGEFSPNSIGYRCKAGDSFMEQLHGTAS